MEISAANNCVRCPPNLRCPPNPPESDSNPRIRLESEGVPESARIRKVSPKSESANPLLLYDLNKPGFADDRIVSDRRQVKVHGRGGNQPVVQFGDIVDLGSRL